MKGILNTQSIQKVSCKILNAMMNSRIYLVNDKLFILHILQVNIENQSSKTLEYRTVLFGENSDCFSTDKCITVCTIVIC